MAATNQQILESTEGLSRQFTAVTSAIAEVQEVAESNSRALRGNNGDPGLVALVRMNTQQISDLATAMERHHLLLFGDEKEDGVVQKVRAFQNERATVLKVIWFAVGAAVSAAAVYLLDKFILL